jgi:hypothetical protein
MKMIENLKKIVPIDLRTRLADFRGRGIYSGYPDKYKCIFIHIPKAAGTSVAKTLFGTGSRHVPYLEYEWANPRKYACYFKFTFVRNPWDRLYSAYAFLKRGGMNEMDQAWAVKNLADYPDFDSFVRGWVNEENIRSWVHFFPQHYFICDENLDVKVDFVGRLEQIDEDIRVVQQRLGLPETALPKNNAGSADKHGHTQRFSEECLSIVARVYHEDIRLFSYG